MGKMFNKLHVPQFALSKDDIICPAPPPIPPQYKAFADSLVQSFSSQLMLPAHLVDSPELPELWGNTLTAADCAAMPSGQTVDDVMQAMQQAKAEMDKLPPLPKTPYQQFAALKSSMMAIAPAYTFKPIHFKPVIKYGPSLLSDSAAVRRLHQVELHAQSNLQRLPPAEFARGDRVGLAYALAEEWVDGFCPRLAEVAARHKLPPPASRVWG